MDRTEEAKAAYLAQRAAKINDKTGAQLIAEDFAELRKAGVAHPMMAEIEAALDPRAPKVAVTPTPAQEPDEGAAASAWLGVQMQNVDAEAAASLGMSRPRGVRVVWLADNGPALAAGIKPHDVILQFNGMAVNDSQKIVDRVKAAAPDTDVRLRLFRNGQEIETIVTLAKRPAELDSGATVNAPQLKLRSCPEFSKQCPEIARMPQGLHVTILGNAANGWVKLQAPAADGKTVEGFANSKLLQY